MKAEWISIFKQDTYAMNVPGGVVLQGEDFNGGMVFVPNAHVERKEEGGELFPGSVEGKT